ncbi:MAG: Flp pilus assembly protein CpaB [Methylacidiphilales bacterium]|nr:Flp pilus assembly protein CpaB [Candidatus Methylacidiphilales bacterium]
MPKKGLTFLIILALALAGLSIYLFKTLLDNAKAQANVAPAPQPEQMEMQKVLIAKEDIPMGKPIGLLDVDTVDFPQKFTPPGALKSMDDLNGKLSAQLIPKGDILLDKKVALPNQLPRASMIVEPGRRLVSIRVDDIKANGYLVKNGDYVDLVGTFPIPDGMAKPGDTANKNLTVTFLQRVKIFDIIYGDEAGSTGQETSGTGPGVGKGKNPAGDKRMARGTATATFDVTPHEAELILTAEGQASNLMLMLRRFDDETITPPPSDLYKDLITNLSGESARKKVEEAPVQPAPQPRKRVL